MAEKAQLIKQPQDQDFGETPKPKANVLQFTVGPPIQDQDLALMEWHDLHYFVPAKAPTTTSSDDTKNQEE